MFESVVLLLEKGLWAGLLSQGTETESDVFTARKD